MAVQAIPFTSFQKLGIETRNRSLRYDMNAMADFEQVTGMGLAKLMNTAAVFAATRALLWAGLKASDRALTIEMAGILMQKYTEADGDINDLLRECLEACVKQKAVPNLKLVDNNDDDGVAEEVPDPNATTQSPNLRPTGISIVPGPVTSESPNSTLTEP